MRGAVVLAGALVAAMAAHAGPAAAHQMQECFLTPQQPGCTLTCAPLRAMLVRANASVPGVSIMMECAGSTAVCFEPFKAKCYGNGTVVLTPAWHTEGTCKLGQGESGYCYVGI